MQNTTEKISKALGVDETSVVLSLYGSVLDEDLALGEPIDQGNKVMDWKAVMQLHNAVRNENWHPNILALNESNCMILFSQKRII